MSCIEKSWTCDYMSVYKMLEGVKRISERKKERILFFLFYVCGSQKSRRKIRHLSCNFTLVSLYKQSLLLRFPVGNCNLEYAVKAVDDGTVLQYLLRSLTGEIVIVSGYFISGIIIHFHQSVFAVVGQEVSRSRASPPLLRVIFPFAS